MDGCISATPFASDGSMRPLASVFLRHRDSYSTKYSSQLAPAVPLRYLTPHCNHANVALGTSPFQHRVRWYAAHAHVTETKRGARAGLHKQILSRAREYPSIGSGVPSSPQQPFTNQNTKKPRRNIYDGKEKPVLHIQHDTDAAKLPN